MNQMLYQAGSLQRQGAGVTQSREQWIMASLGRCNQVFNPIGL